jgi:hypothetical protein
MLHLQSLHPDVLPATTDFWKNHPPVPKKSRFVIDSDEDSSESDQEEGSSGKISEDGYAQDRPAEESSHQGEKVPESTVPMGASANGRDEWRFVDPTKDSEVYANSSQ